ncbi:MAG: hypothetical protein WCJ72_09940 [Chryseobacterium sp.]
MKKINNKKGYDDLWSKHYQYCGKSFKINSLSHVMIVLCNNCNENHACNYQNCELVYNQKGQIQTFELFNVKADGIILIQSKQTIEAINYEYQHLIYVSIGKIISEQYFFANVTQTQNNKMYEKHRPYKFCIFNPTQTVLIYIHTYIFNNIDKKYPYQLAYGWTFFCLCDCERMHQDNVYFELSSPKNTLISVQCNKPNIPQYYILSEKHTPPSLFNLSLSSVAQHNLNHTLNKNSTILPNTICEKFPNCHQCHVTPLAIEHNNIRCTGNSEHSNLISDW